MSDIQEYEIHPEYAKALRAIINDPRQPNVIRIAAIKEYRYLAQNMPKGASIEGDDEYLADFAGEFFEEFPAPND